jgi:hypothetical protein
MDHKGKFNMTSFNSDELDYLKSQLKEALHDEDYSLIYDDAFDSESIDLNSPDTEKLLNLFSLLPKFNKNNSYKILFNESDNGFNLKIMEESFSDKNRLTEVFKFPFNSKEKFDTLESLIGKVENYFENSLEESFNKYSQLKNKVSDNKNVAMPDTRKLKKLATLYFKDQDLSDSCEVQFRSAPTNGKDVLSFTIFFSEKSNPLGEVLCYFPIKNFHSGRIIPNSGDNSENFSELVKNAEVTLVNLLKEKIKNLDTVKERINRYLVSSGKAKPVVNSKEHFNKIFKEIGNVSSNKLDSMTKIIRILADKYARLIDSKTTGAFEFCKDNDKRFIRVISTQLKKSCRCLNSEECAECETYEETNRKVLCETKRINSSCTDEEMIRIGIEEIKKNIDVLNGRKAKSNFIKLEEKSNEDELFQVYKKSAFDVLKEQADEYKLMKDDVNKKLNDDSDKLSVKLNSLVDEYFKHFTMPKDIKPTYKIDKDNYGDFISLGAYDDKGKFVSEFETKRYLRLSREDLMKLAISEIENKLEIESKLLSKQNWADHVRLKNLSTKEVNTVNELLDLCKEEVGFVPENDTKYNKLTYLFSSNTKLRNVVNSYVDLIVPGAKVNYKFNNDGYYKSISVYAVSPFEFAKEATKLVYESKKFLETDHIEVIDMIIEDLNLKMEELKKEKCFNDKEIKHNFRGPFRR